MPVDCPEAITPPFPNPGRLRMSPKTATDQAATPSDGVNQQTQNHAIHVKDVPYDVWCMARHNANLSRMAFRDYVLRVLKDAKPYPPS